MSLGLTVSGLVVLGGAVSARWNWWRRPISGIPILMYHKVGIAPEGSKLKKLWVSPDMLRKQSGYLSRWGYQSIVFKELYDYWDKNRSLPKKPVLITFDDGYENNYSEAFPILKDFGFRATLFVVGQTVGGENQWHDPKTEQRIPMVSWSQLKDLQKAGWEIGSHTMTHPRLANLNLKDVQQEVEKSRRVIGEFMDEVPNTFAYPYGNGEDDPKIRDAVKNAGYRLAVGVHTGIWNLDSFKERAFQLPRIFVRGDENIFDFHLQMTRGQSRF